MTPSQARALVALAGRLFLRWHGWPVCHGDGLQIAVLLLVAETTGSYGKGGARGRVPGARVREIGGPVSGVLADRLGQRIVLLVAGPTHAVGLVAVTLLAVRHAPPAVLLPVAALTGAFVPQGGRWSGPVGRSGPARRRCRAAGQAALRRRSPMRARRRGHVRGRAALVGVLATVAVRGGAARGRGVVTTVTCFAVHWTVTLVHPGARDLVPADHAARPGRTSAPRPTWWR